MALQQFFAAATVLEARQAQAFQKHFALGLPLLKLPFQPGVAGDYRVQNEGGSELFNSLFEHTVIEFKSDGKSLYSKHFFFEFEQTSDGWFSWSESGHVLALNTGCLLVIGVKQKYYCFDLASYTSMFNAGKYETRTTGSRKNGNMPGMFTRGWRIPVPVVKKFATYVFTVSKMST